MKIGSSVRLGVGAAALLMVGCGGVTDERQSSGGASGSGGAGATSSSSVTGTGSGGDAPCPSMAWSHAYSSLGAEASGTGVAVDAACNVYLAGWYDGKLDLGAGPLDGNGYALFLAKLDPEGHTLWSRGFGDESTMVSPRLALDPSGNVLLTGTFHGSLDFGDGCAVSAYLDSAFVAKLDGDGKSIFCHGFHSNSPDGGISGTSVASNAAGDVIVGGGFSGDLDFGSGTIPNQGGPAGFVVAFEPGGQLRWAIPLSGTGYASTNAVTISPEGVIHVGGEFEGSLALGLDSAGGKDIFVAEISADGTATWARRLGGPGYDHLTAMAPGAQGGLVIAGMSEGGIDLGAGPLAGEGSTDALVARLDAAGNAVSGRLYGDAGAQSLDSMAADAMGNVLVTGMYRGTIDLGGGPLPPAKPGSQNMFAAKLDPDGKSIWSRGVSSPDTHGYAVTLDRSSNALVTGKFRKIFDLGSGAVESPSGTAIFVAKVGS